MNALEKKQQAIREGLAAAFITTGRCYNCTKEAQDECAYCDADVALRYLTGKGAVLTMSHVDWTEKDFPHTELALIASLTKEGSLAVHTARKTPRTIPPD